MNYCMDIRTQIKKVIQLQCPICYREYDDKYIIPMLICSGQHSLCKQCLRATFDNLDDDQPGNCPICSEQFTQEYTSKFRLMDEVVQITKYIENYCEVKQEEFKHLQGQNKKLNYKLVKQKQIYQKTNQELSKAKNKIRQMSKSKSKDKTKKVTNYYLKSNASTKRQNKSTKKSSSFYTNVQKNDKEYKDKAQKRCSPFSDFFNDSNQILKPKMTEQSMEVNLKIYDQLHLYSKRMMNIKCPNSKQKLPMPYFVNKKAISSNQIHQIKKSEKRATKMSIRQYCIDVLLRYNFSKVIQLNLSRLDFTQAYFTTLELKHTLLNVQRLNFSNNRLTSIPKFILELKHLRLINLNYNQLTSITPQISNLMYLQTLLFWNNKLKDIPEQISQLLYLSEIQLSNNLIKQVPILFCFNKKLKKIGFYGNPIKWTQDDLQILHQLRSKSIKVELK